MNLRSLLPFGGPENALARAEARPFTALQREIDRVFADFGRDWPALRGMDLTPRMDVVERDNEIEITAELPGLEEKEVEVKIAGNALVISGEKKIDKEEKNDHRYVVERSYGAFSRSIELPEGVKPEDTKASMAKGVLRITIPKVAVPKPEAKTIEVKAAA
jgi:HSP20 family protein